MLIIASITCIGVLLLLWGLRGKVTSRTANCRKCKYDLSVLDPLPSRCPECGRDLAKKRAVRPVVRRKRRLPFAFALLCFALAGVGFDQLQWYRANQSWIPKASTWALINFGLQHTHHDREIYNELRLRIEADQVSDAHIIALARISIRDLKHLDDRAFDSPFVTHSNFQNTWNSAQSAIILEAIASGLLTEKEERAFYSNGVRVSLYPSLTYADPNGPSFVNPVDESRGFILGSFAPPKRLTLRGHPIPVHNVETSYGDIYLDEQPVAHNKMPNKSSSSDTVPHPSLRLSLNFIERFAYESNPYQPLAYPNIVFPSLPAGLSGTHTISSTCTFTSDTLGTWTKPFEQEIRVINAQTRNRLTQHIQETLRSQAALRYRSTMGDVHPSAQTKFQMYFRDDAALDQSIELLHFYEPPRISFASQFGLHPGPNVLESLDRAHMQYGTAQRTPETVFIASIFPPSAYANVTFPMCVVILKEPGFEGITGEVVLLNSPLTFPGIPIENLPEATPEHSSAP